MSRLPHRIYQGLQLLADGVSTTEKFLDNFGKALPFHSAPSLGRAVGQFRDRGGMSASDSLRQYASHIIFDLREQGFAIEDGDGIILTKKGREKLKQLVRRFKKLVPLKKYAVEKSAELVIVSFDIPERDRHKRAWLREVLTNLDLKLYHHSLWMGTVIVPEEFIRDLVDQGLDRYVAIFTVGKKGTLRKIV